MDYCWLARKRASRHSTEIKFMLYTLAVILIILWLLGMVTGTAGGLIHILLLIAIVAVLLRVISGRKAI
jgi:hypothetical protein